jgi:hypothetical protein
LAAWFCRTISWAGQARAGCGLDAGAAGWAAAKTSPNVTTNPSGALGGRWRAGSAGMGLVLKLQAGAYHTMSPAPVKLVGRRQPLLDGRGTPAQAPIEG